MKLWFAGGARVMLVMAAGTVGLAAIACSGDAPRPSAVREGVLTLSSGDSLWFAVVGTGKDTVVLVPGGPSLGHAYLSDVTRGLATDHAVLVYDPRGRGRSSPIAIEQPGVTARSDAADLVALLDTVKLLRPAFVAHGYGAVVVGELAKSVPARIGRVAILAPELGSPVAVYDLASESMDSAAVRAYGEDTRDSLHLRDESEYCRKHWGFQFAPIEDLRPAVVTALGDSACAGRTTTRPTSREAGALKGSILSGYGTSFTHWDAFANVPVQVLVVQGINDPLHQFWSRVWAASARNGRIVEVAGASGTFPWVDQPAAVTRALHQFLSGEWPADSRAVPLELSRPAGLEKGSQ